jgi:hypothetical protein
MYDCTVTLNLPRTVRVRTLGNRYIVKGGFGKAILKILVAAARSELHSSLDTNVLGFQVLSDDVLKHQLFEILNEQPHAAVLRKGESVKHTSPLPSRDRRVLTVVPKSLAVDGMTTFSALSWAV